ncbi:hypothetical protein ACIRPH_31315 [Nocardiopsis sp. NPDC101807]|uniref:hypothetical protein n=1 Tax=Nocardiopsis sp. NPDC101807 TaxID=3364339 RepID=UPI00380089C6
MRLTPARKRPPLLESGAARNNTTEKITVDKPWMVRPDNGSPRYPWIWFCKNRIKLGLVDRACSKWGLASTEDDAHASALGHAREVHDYDSAPA